MPTLVYVHGRGQKNTTELEHDKWYDSLEIGLGRLAPQTTPSIASTDLKLAYWSDLFYPPKAGRSTARTRGARAAETAGITDEETRLAEIVARTYLDAHLTLRTAVAPELAAIPGQAVPPRAATRAIGADPAAAASTGQDVAKYEDGFMQDVVKYFGLGFAEKVSPPLVNILTEGDFSDGLMIVSHSFGTLVGFDVIVRRLPDIDAARAAAGRPPLHIDTWVTMGCPLGWALDLQQSMPSWLQMAIIQAGELQNRAEQAIDSVRQRIDELRQRLGLGRATRGPQITQLGTKQFPPTGVDRWFNIYDPQDWISFPPVVGALGIGTITVGDTFLSNGVQRAFDISIINDFRKPGVQVLDMEAHNDRGYGECAQLAQLVDDFWIRHQTPGGG